MATFDDESESAPAWIANDEWKKGEELGQGAFGAVYKVMGLKLTRVTRKSSCDNGAEV